jgi:hypothetical protein
MFVAMLLIPFGILQMVMRVIAPRFDFGAFAIPLVRNVFPALTLADIVSVQPMTGPSGKVFYMDYKYDSEKQTKIVL